MVTRLAPEQLCGWATARSIARRLPAPVADHGGWRVDTASETEQCRYFFADPIDSIRALAASIDRPGVFIKLCASDATLASFLPAHWKLDPPHWAMIGGAWRRSVLPAGYRIDRREQDRAVHIRIIADNGDVVARGYGAQALGVFAYDRIVTDAAYRRRGFAKAVMAELGQAASPDAAHVLMATAMGRSLYETIGWRIASPYATAFIPPA